MTQPAYRKKLIEVALPLEAINREAAREKSIRHGHPSTLHLWWARRPLAACRAVLFAQLVDDPSSHPDKFPTEEAQRKERKRLFALMEKLVKWENSTNEELLRQAHEEIRKSCGDELPIVYDPFCGGGSIPLEAQRLGLEAHASDLNPVAVTITRAMVEIPPLFKDKPPVHPGGQERTHYRHAEGLAEDVRYYGQWMRERAFERIGHLYPKVKLPAAYGGEEATVIAWIWARTVPSPDPAFADVHVPLVSSFLLSSKKGKEAWIEPQVDHASKRITYRIRTGGTKEDWAKARKGTKAARGAHFICLFTGTAIHPDYVKACGREGKMGAQLIAIVAEGKSGRVYVAPNEEHERIARSARPKWRPETPLPGDMRAFWTPPYGIRTFGDLFTDRQLVALTTFADLVEEARAQIERDALTAGLPDDSTPLREGGTGAKAYAEAVSVYLAFLIDQLANHSSTICSWNSVNQQMRSVFSRQAIPMTWDFAEVNIFSNSSGAYSSLFYRLAKGFKSILIKNHKSMIFMSNAVNSIIKNNYCISTDPPYYDNIGYADLSDFFYIWLRKTLYSVYPEQFLTISTPKTEELIATPYRFKSKEEAEQHFLEGMKQAISNMAIHANPNCPATIYYAFKQKEIEQEGIASTGWATFLQAVIDAGYVVLGTWPLRTEKPGRMISVGTNALANSVVLVCRPRPEDAPSITRNEFIAALKEELPEALAELQNSNIAPADMPQSAIGPGIGIFSRYAAVLEPDDTPMSVRSALMLINAELDEYFAGLEGDFDPETRFAITWFEQHGFNSGDYGTANSIATARGISVEQVSHAGIVRARAGKVKLLSLEELKEDWRPDTDQHLSDWECCHYLIRALELAGGEEAAAKLLRLMGGERAEKARELAYRLYNICEKKGWAQEAVRYNMLISVWRQLEDRAANLTDTDLRGDGQQRLL